MLAELPIEIQVRLLKLCPSSSLKLTNSFFYLLYNELFLDKLTKTFGDDVLLIVAKIYPWLRTYIKSLDHFRFDSRNVIASRLKLKDIPFVKGMTLEDILNAEYINDSWKYVYSLLKNRRLFAEYSDYKIDEPTNYVYNHYVEINRTYLLSYHKTIWLAPGKYNLNIGLVVKHGNGLGTTKFEIKHTMANGKERVLTFFPPTNIKEILPKNQFCFLKIAEFELPPINSCANREGKHKCLHKIQITMEEIGLYLKSGFRIYFIDISLPSMIFNDYDLLYYSCLETNYKLYIYLPLKNLYKALNMVQGDNDFNNSSDHDSDDLGSIQPEYDFNYNFDNEHALEDANEQLVAYAKFFFNNSKNKRYFKFNTVYQKRQFINRFGDFSLEEDNGNCCMYDRQGIKWRMPILGEL